MTPSPPSRAMWMAIECSVTVSMGEERRGVLSEMRLVTGESRVTSDAAKPSEDQIRSCKCAERERVASPINPGRIKKSL